jgi:ribosome-binding protein aMBF1 (putative translation factor)
MQIEASIRRIRAFAEAAGLAKGRLAVRAGLRDTVLRHFDSPDWNPTRETLCRLEAIIPADFLTGDLPAAETGDRQ